MGVVANFTSIRLSSSGYGFRSMTFCGSGQIKGLSIKTETTLMNDTFSSKTLNVVLSDNVKTQMLIFYTGGRRGGGGGGISPLRMGHKVTNKIPQKNCYSYMIKKSMHVIIAPNWLRGQQILLSQTKCDLRYGRDVKIPSGEWSKTAKCQSRFVFESLGWECYGRNGTVDILPFYPIPRTSGSTREILAYVEMITLPNVGLLANFSAYLMFTTEPVAAGELITREAQTFPWNWSLISTLKHFFSLV